MTIRVLASMAMLGSVALAEIQGELANSAPPWFVVDDSSHIHQCKWTGSGDTVGFYEGDTVYLSTGDGDCVMSSSADGAGHRAEVWVTALDYTGGVILNDGSPWLVGDDDSKYRVEFLDGQADYFHKDDSVILSKSSGTGYMLRVSGTIKVAKVSIEEDE
ncbi:MAG TPA: hypothetical protein VMH22_12355 [bacterium]|nr:hypothetical protein [bacterium]